MFKAKPMRSGKVIACEHKEVLTDSQYEKLECKELQERIDTLCKDMHIERYIEDNGNVKISVISRNLETFDDEALHDMEMTHTSFLSAIDKMEMPTDEVENADDSNRCGVEDKEIDAEWIQGFVDNLNKLDGPCCAEVIMNHPLFDIPIGTGMRLSKKTLIRILECFIEHNK